MEHACRRESYIFPFQSPFLFCFLSGNQFIFCLLVQYRLVFFASCYVIAIVHHVTSLSVFFWFKNSVLFQLYSVDVSSREPHVQILLVITFFPFYFLLFFVLLRFRFISLKFSCSESIVKIKRANSNRTRMLSTELRPAKRWATYIYICKANILKINCNN